MAVFFESLHSLEIFYLLLEKEDPCPSQDEAAWCFLKLCWAVQGYLLSVVMLWDVGLGVWIVSGACQKFQKSSTGGNNMLWKAQGVIKRTPSYHCRPACPSCCLTTRRRFVVKTRMRDLSTGKRYLPGNIELMGHVQSRKVQKQIKIRLHSSTKREKRPQLTRSVGGLASNMQICVKQPGRAAIRDSKNIDEYVSK